MCFFEVRSASAVLFEPNYGRYIIFGNIRNKSKSRDRVHKTFRARIHDVRNRRLPRKFALFFCSEIKVSRFHYRHRHRFAVRKPGVGWRATEQIAHKERKNYNHKFAREISRERYIIKIIIIIYIIIVIVIIRRLLIDQRNLSVKPEKLRVIVPTVRVRFAESECSYRAIPMS